MKFGNKSLNYGDLLGAIEGGCPQCGEHDFELFEWSKWQYPLYINTETGQRFVTTRSGDYIGDRHEVSVKCTGCQFTLWDDIEGWHKYEGDQK